MHKAGRDAAVRIMTNGIASGRREIERERVRQTERETDAEERENGRTVRGGIPRQTKQTKTGRESRLKTCRIVYENYVLVTTFHPAQA